MRRILRFLKHAAIEFQPAQFAIDEIARVRKALWLGIGAEGDDGFLGGLSLALWHVLTCRSQMLMAKQIADLRRQLQRLTSERSQPDVDRGAIR